MNNSEVLKKLVKVALTQQKVLKKLTANKKTFIKKAKLDLPDDYEPCGYCGFDHGYDYESAVKWHNMHDPENTIYDDKEVLDLLSDASDRQLKLNKLISKYAQQTLNPGQTAVDFDGSGEGVKQHDTVGDLKDPNKHVNDESTTIMKNLTQTEQYAIASLKVEGNTVKVKFKPNQGTDQIFNALLKAVEKAIPYKTMSVREVV